MIKNRDTLFLILTIAFIAIVITVLSIL